MNNNNNNNNNHNNNQRQSGWPGLRKNFVTPFDAQGHAQGHATPPVTGNGHDNNNVHLSRAHQRPERSHDTY